MPGASASKAAHPVTSCSSRCSILANWRWAKYFSRRSSQRCSAGFRWGLHGGKGTSRMLWSVWVVAWPCASPPHRAPSESILPDAVGRPRRETSPSFRHLPWAAPACPALPRAGSPPRHIRTRVRSGPARWVACLWAPNTVAVHSSGQSVLRPPTSAGPGGPRPSAVFPLGPRRRIFFKFLLHGHVRLRMLRSWLDFAPALPMQPR
jgi:hypothetical protein